MKQNLLEDIGVHLAGMPHPNTAYSYVFTHTESEYIAYLDTLHAESATLSLTYSYGLQIVHLCVLKNWKIALRYLIEKGCSLDEQDLSGSTPMHLAHSKQVFQLMMTGGADPYIQDYHGRTPALMAYLNGWIQFSKPTVDVNQKFYPFYQWLPNTRWWIWAHEVGIYTQEDFANTAPVQSFFSGEIESEMREQLPEFIRQITHQADSILEVVCEPRLSPSDHTVRLSKPISRGRLVALYVGEVGVINLDVPKNASYTFEQSPFFVDATDQGGFTELINDSFPNLVTVTLEDNGVVYTGLMTTQDLQKGQYLYYFYGQTHPLPNSKHVELNEHALNDWLSKFSPLPSHLPVDIPTIGNDSWERIDYISKWNYVMHRTKKD